MEAKYYISEFNHKNKYWKMHSVCRILLHCKIKLSHLLIFMNTFFKTWPKNCNIKFLSSRLHLLSNKFDKLNLRKLSLRKVCIRNCSGPYSLWMRKNVNQNNSEYRQFSRSVWDQNFMQPWSIAFVLPPLPLLQLTQEFYEAVAKCYAPSLIYCRGIFM